MRLYAGSALAGITAAFLAIAPAGAQTWTAEGRIETTDQRDRDERRYDDHRVPLQAGQRVRISAESDDFDSMLEVYAPGAMDAPIAADDDSGGELNPRLTLNVPATGDYVVRVLTFGTEATGAYSLRVEPLAPLPTPRPLTGQTETMNWTVVRGAFAEGDPADEGYYHDYALALREGERVLISLDAGTVGGGEEWDGIDPLLHVYRAAERGDGEPIASNDDSGNSLNSFLVFTAPETGDYVIRATTYSAGETGGYVLRVARR